MELLTNFVPKRIEVDNILKRCSTIIHAPASNPEKPIELAYHLPHTVELIATIENITNLSKIIVQVQLSENKLLGEHGESLTLFFIGAFMFCSSATNAIQIALYYASSLVKCNRYFDILVASL